jgi:hypothetical protein
MSHLVIAASLILVALGGLLLPRMAVALAPAHVKRRRDR